MQEFLHPRRPVLQQGFGGVEGSHCFLYFIQKKHAVGDRKHAVDFVRHHHHRGAQVVAQLQYQAVQPRGVDGVQARAGFVQKQQRRVQRQRPRQAGALAHAATQLRRHEVEGTVQPDERQLQPRPLFTRLAWQRREQAQRQHQVFTHRHGTPQGTGLEQHAKALTQAAQRGFVTVVQVLAFDQHLALLRLLQADQVAQQ